MLSGVTRGACPPVYLDKATGTRTQLRRGHAGETHAYIRLWKYFDWFLSQCIRGSRRLTALNLHVWLEQISQAPPPPLFTAWTCTFWVTSKKKNNNLILTVVMMYKCPCYTVVMWQRQNTGRLNAQRWMLRHITAVTWWHDIILPDSPSFLNS